MGEGTPHLGFRTSLGSQRRREPIVQSQLFCAIDDQEHSGWAVDVAIEIARTMAARLIFFMANPAVLQSNGLPVYRWTQEYIDAFFDEVTWRSKANGIEDVECFAKNADDIVDSILFELRKADADFIILGSNHRADTASVGGRRSVSHQLAGKSHCPLIVVRSNPRMSLELPDPPESA